MIKLIQNETIKTFKKTSTKILIILAILALFAAMRFFKVNYIFKQICNRNYEYSRMARTDENRNILFKKTNYGSRQV